MNARRFNYFMSGINENWTVEVLKMQRNPRHGPDLIDDVKAIEVKFRIVGEKAGAERYPQIWTVQDHQVNYRSGGKFYWAFGEYELGIPVRKVRTENVLSLEKLVIKRDLWIVNGEWINQFLPSRCTGQTEHSKWDNTFRYARKDKLPKTTKQIEVRKGIIYFTDGVNLKDFPILSAPDNL